MHIVKQKRLNKSTENTSKKLLSTIIIDTSAI